MLRASLIYLVVRVLNGVVAFATLYVLTRVLSARDYGSFALGAAAIGVGATVMYEWLAVGVSRFYAKYVDQPGSLLREAYRLFGVVSAVGVLVAACAMYWTPSSVASTEVIAVVFVGAVLAGLYSIGLQVANARRDPVRYGLMSLSRGLFALACAVVLAHVMPNAGVGALIGLVMGYGLSIALFTPRGSTGSKRPEILHQLVRYGAPLTLTYLAARILDVSDRFMLAWLKGAEAVAGYAAAYDLTQQSIGALLNVLFLAAYPRVTAAWEARGAVGAAQAMAPHTRAMFLLVPLVASAFFHFADDISSLAFGGGLRSDAAQVMPWIAAAVAIGCFKNYYLDVGFQLAKTTGMQLRVTVAMAIANVALNFALIPRLGGEGAAISTLLAMLVGAGLSWWFGQRHSIYPPLLKPLITMLVVGSAAAAAAELARAIAYESRWGFLLGGAGGALGYGVATLITNLAGSRDWVLEQVRSRRCAKSSTVKVD